MVVAPSSGVDLLEWPLAVASVTTRALRTTLVDRGVESDPATK